VYAVMRDADLVLLPYHSFGTIYLISDGGRAHSITMFIYYDVYVLCGVLQ